MLRKGAEFREFRERGWFAMVPPNLDDLKPWTEARERLFKRLWPFFTTMFEGEWLQYSELFRQILFSARLFRRGAETSSYGMEYLCKWIAIEALAGTGEKKNKGSFVADRISSLFTADCKAIREEVLDLWKRRHSIAHEAKAEFFHEAAVDNAFAIYVPRLDHLATVVMAFAIDNLTQADTVSKLWDSAEAWSLPEDILIQRPKSAGRIAAEKIVLDHGVRWSGIGRTLDAAFAGEQQSQT